MKELIRLPVDTSGYGRYGLTLVGLILKIEFEYRADSGDKIGQLEFGHVREFQVLDRRYHIEKIPTWEDTIYTEETERYPDRNYKIYICSLSNSGLIFEVIAETVEFIANLQHGQILAPV